MLNVEAAQRHVPKPDEFICSILDDVVSDSHRAIDMVESTRAIFGKSSGGKSPADLNQLVRDTLVMISQVLRDRAVSVDLRLDASLPPIAVNRPQIQQAFFNLFTNAADAMSAVNDRPRILTIRTGSVENGLLVRVEDTGAGLSAADQKGILEPFYTTKGHGTGVGLLICRSVISAHGGQLRVKANAPAGTIFEIYLPHDGGAGAAV
jgi:C4-dicarboxylate-specific signal transduction histidine kinase